MIPYIVTCSLFVLKTLFELNYFLLQLLQILPYNALDSPTQFDILQYLDLDLDVDNNTTCTGSLSNLQANSNMHPPRPNSRVTVYKTVDFVKTDAFNRIKKTCEAERNKLPPSDP